MDVNDYLSVYSSYNGVRQKTETPPDFPYLDIVSKPRTHTVEIDFIRKTEPNLFYKLLIKHIIVDLCGGKYIGNHGAWCMGKFKNQRTLVQCCQFIEYIWLNLDQGLSIETLIAQSLPFLRNTIY
jgi:hypothetical protein